ncbi:hypothetical protein ACFL3G_01915 [Planctomycetota bacterium]
MKRKRHINKTKVQSAVSCPNKIRKRIVRNLQRSSLNRFNKPCANKAAELLVAINVEPNVVVPQTQNNPDITKASVDAVKAAALPTQNTASKVWAFVSNTCKKYMSHTIAFGKRKRHFQPAHI